VFLYGQTQPGQDMFLRGGLDHAQAQARLGRACTDSNYACALPIAHRNWRNATTSVWKTSDTFLDWYGQEFAQTGAPAANPGYGAVGSAADWTTNDAGNPSRVSINGFGYEPLNAWGDHYWMLDVDMDCSKAFADAAGARWFEVKSFISNGPGWEPDVTQAGAPYASGNHFARCGMVSVFQRGNSTARFVALP
jgi:alpha-amylase